jgi:hypothetical protein
MIENSLPESELAARFAAAQVLAREAGALAIALRGGPASAFGVETKSTLDFATEADRAVERLVIERLGKRFGDGLRKGNQIIACTPELRETLTGLMAADQAVIT